jgi:D-sedoheptulose 7-phosphate isomerase
MNNFKQYLGKFDQVLSGLVTTDEFQNEINIEEAYSVFSELLNSVRTQNHTVYLIGNGGSNGIISHTSVDLLNSCKIKAFPLTDSSQITCFANDFGYESVFSKPLETLLSAGDILIAVSSSGNSKNIVNAVKLARSKGNSVVSFSGFKQDNSLRQTGNLNFWLDSKDYGIVEIGHAFILHYLTDRICLLI